MKKEPMFKDFNEFIDWASGKFLTEFINEGGKGIRCAVIAIINTYVSWQREEGKLKQKGTS